MGEKTVMIVAGESSGELYGALLAGELRDLMPGVRILGVGGQRMKEAGVEVFAGIAGAFGLTEALSAYRDVRRSYRKAVGALTKDRPDVVVLIDYPDFNFRLAARAKEQGIPVLYYVSPQVWAWRRGRVKTMARIADRVAVVLPFEEEIYRESGLPCEFVGHPVLDDMSSPTGDKAKAKEALGLEADRPYLAVLPGSRRSELSRLLPLVLAVVRGFRARHPEYGYVLPVAPNVRTEEYRSWFDALKREGVAVTHEGAVLAFDASEAAVVASGTAALQAVLREVPLVVIYKVFPLTYFLGRIFINVKFINIANLILGREAVPELIQKEATPEGVLEALEPLLAEGSRRERMLEDLRAVKGMFGERRPSRRVAEMVAEMAGGRA
jgi:lipid-A-disaccharide synthase